MGPKVGGDVGTLVGESDGDCVGLFVGALVGEGDGGDELGTSAETDELVGPPEFVEQLAATFDDDPEANTVHSDVLRRLRGENADVSNESGVFKSGVSRRRGIRRRVSRRRERRFLNASRTAVSRERCLFVSFDFAFRVGENAILATTAHSDVLRRPVAKTLASAIRKEGRKHDRPQTPRTATFS